jgi:hypothetical protein
LKREQHDPGAPARREREDAEHVAFFAVEELERRNRFRFGLDGGVPLQVERRVVEERQSDDQ